MGGDRSSEPTNGAIIASAAWSRLDAPGMDACRVEVLAHGYRLQGKAVFVHDARAAALDYELRCREDWTVVEGRVDGFVGDAVVSWRIERRDDGEWMLNGRAVPSVRGLYDLDFGFTPATNFQQLRRIGLAAGARAEFSVAWIDVDSATLQPLPQRYHRHGPSTMWYESPTVGYRETLVLRPDGLVADYPGLWRALDAP